MVSSFYNFSEFSYVADTGFCYRDVDSGLEEESYCSIRGNFDKMYAKILENMCNEYELFKIMNNKQKKICVSEGKILYLYYILGPQPFLILYTSKYIQFTPLKRDGSLFVNLTSDIFDYDKFDFIHFPHTFDLKSEIIYVSFKNIILEYKIIPKHPFFVLSPVSFVENEVRAMSYDPFTNSLIYIDYCHNLTLLSLTSNYQKVIRSSVKSYSFHPEEATVSYVTLDNKLCFLSLFSISDCFQTNLNITNAVINRAHSLVYLHLADLSLIVYRFSFDSKNNLSNPLYEINEVVSFAAIDTNLYYLKNYRIYQVSLGFKNIALFMQYNPYLMSFSVHAGNSECILLNYSHTRHFCDLKNCNFMCFAKFNSQDICVCPEYTELKEDNSCSCSKNDSECLSKQLIII
ncbi:LOW QUALITY PROTEIN: hypothetical protein HZS_4746 [Henneguya salminicola]|nr:LOW QUALITY PROTEIN: hypothetical protein HZS_4746 [Henneguya salminicola]